jgi:16S rRNA (cytidine1402-2'-O)-methyltransferase
MREGALVALVSDAGTPLVSDPGFALVRAAIAAEIPLEVLPGPSAALTALVASGLPVDRWRFVGFLPRARRELESLLAEAAETLVAFESPRRLAASLGALAARDPGRPVAVCRELTKLHEEVRRGSAAELAEHYRDHPARGEVVLVCGAAAPGTPRREEALAALRELVAAGAKPRPAAAAIGRLTGLAANELYRELTGRGSAARQ